MTYAQLPPTIRATAETALTPKQLEAWKLELAGHGTRRIAIHLRITRSSVQSRLDHAHHALHAAGVRQTANGTWYLEEAA